MQAGDLRARVGFYVRPLQSDGYGNTEASEFPADPEFAVAANVKPKLGGENVLAGRLTGTNLVNITVRQSIQTALVTTEWRCKDERTGVIYNIRSKIDPYEGDADHGKWWEMLCEKGVAT